jgi:6-phosphogluconolactonase/glucosamine-6-phosphate isomerase/deaminase
MPPDLPALEAAASRPGLFLRRFASPEAVSAATSNLLRNALGGHAGGRRVVMLSGGRTPLAVYADLAAHPEHAAPGAIAVFSDERVVPRHSPDNNFHQALPFLEAWGLVGDRAIAVHTELPALQALEVFQHKLARLKADETSFPLALLGVGADGHTAGLFNQEHLEQAAGRCAILVPRPDGLDGITATPMVLSWFDRVVVLATGAAKRPRITEWFTGSADVIAGLATASCPLVEIWADPAAAPVAPPA